ncbi:MAG TPA: ATP-binding cassette domain-containing protein [Thermomicrobiales bacterium]|nr:ATP-binding cassette domain-containing protein [Thermomicrobiales bacterium]
MRAVDDVTFEVADGELCVLIGPSGSGKTTTMRMINRLESISRGTISIDGKDVMPMNVAELRRNIGYVIQQGGLFPHFTVAENVSVVPKLLGWSKQRRRERAEDLLELVGLNPRLHADRYPSQLSGGQQQRVGVARALAADADIILMDEPFGAVDPITRNQLQRWLRQIQAEVHKTIVFVTHDINEAFLLGDRIVLMNNGAIEQNGTPEELLREPASDFVREFIGDEFALQALEHTYIEELARTGGPRPPKNALILPGKLSLAEASRALREAEGVGGEGFWVATEEGEPEGYVTYHEFAAMLGEGVASATMVSDENVDGDAGEIIADRSEAHGKEDAGAVHPR